MKFLIFVKIVKITSIQFHLKTLKFKNIIDVIHKSTHIAHVLKCHKKPKASRNVLNGPLNKSIWRKEEFSLHKLK
jgi:hypothetical protein